MRAARNFVRLARLLASGRENRLDLPRWLVRRPAIFAGIGVAEAAEMLSNRLDGHLKLLAQFRVASMVGCEFCLDVGAALAQYEEVSERQLLELHDFERSDAFDDAERLVLRFATSLSQVPATVPTELREDLLRRFTKAQLVELAAAIAHEHQRTRLYLALGVRPARFAPDDACRVLPVHEGQEARGCAAGSLRGAPVQSEPQLCSHHAFLEWELRNGSDPRGGANGFSVRRHAANPA